MTEQQAPSMRVAEAKRPWADTFSGNSSGDWVRLAEAEAKLDAAARVAGCPDPGSREPWTGRRLFEFFEHEAERGRGWPRLIKLGKVHWENLAARIESEIAAAGCPDEGQRQEQAEEREARDEWREIRRLERERDEWKDALKRENARLVDERDAARSIALGVAPRAALGAVAASPDEGMPVFTVKAKDNLALDAVAAYLALCREHDLDEQAAEVEKAYAEIRDWRAANPHRWKMPDHTHVPVVAPVAGPADEGLRQALTELVEAVGVDHGKRSERAHIRKEVKGERVAAALRRARAVLGEH